MIERLQSMLVSMPRLAALVLLMMSVAAVLYPLATNAGPPADDPDQGSVTETATTEVIPPAGEVHVGSLPPVSPSGGYDTPQVMPILYPAAPNKENAPAEVPEATPIPEDGLLRGLCQD